MPLRLEPQDEYMHKLGPEPNFNESMYFNVYDPSSRVGGFVRLGNRANEGYAEMTVCLYLPDGRVGFMFSRPKISDNAGFDAGGLRFDVVRPFEELHVSYQGPLLLLDDPLSLVGTALLAGPVVLPLAHRELRSFVRLHGVADRP